MMLEYVKTMSGLTKLTYKLIQMSHVSKVFMGTSTFVPNVYIPTGKVNSKRAWTAKFRCGDFMVLHDS